MLGIKDSESYDDFIGYLSARNTYKVFTHPDKSNLSDKAKGNIKKSFSTFNDLLKTKRLGYFGLEEPKTKDTRVLEAYKKRVYYMLAIVGQIRQCVFMTCQNTQSMTFTALLTIAKSVQRVQRNS